MLGTGLCLQLREALAFLFVIKLAEPAELTVLQLPFLCSVQKDKL